MRRWPEKGAAGTKYAGKGNNQGCQCVTKAKRGPTELLLFWLVKNDLVLQEFSLLRRSSERPQGEGKKRQWEKHKREKKEWEKHKREKKLVEISPLIFTQVGGKEQGDNWRKHIFSSQRLVHYNCKDSLCLANFPPSTILKIKPYHLR